MRLSNRNKIFRHKTKTEDWLAQYNITNYTLVPDTYYGYTVNVHQRVDLSRKNLTHLAVKFNHVEGDFICYDNKLETMLGAPNTLDGYFTCAGNQLKSLVGAPRVIPGDFFCNYNHLSTLIGSPQKIDGLYNCGHNQLTSLVGGPQTVRSHFACNINQLLSLDFLPSVIGGQICIERNDLLGELQKINNVDIVRSILERSQLKEIIQSVKPSRSYKI